MRNRIEAGWGFCAARLSANGRLCARGLTLALAWLLGVDLAWLANAADSDASPTFESANRLYEEGHFKAAAEAYEKLIGNGRVSGALYFNAGNAWYKAGDLGQAIFHYRLAERLAPRDPDVQVNLRMARELVNGGPLPAASGWRRWVPRLSVNEWAGLVAVLLWACCSLLAWGELRTAQRASLRRWAVLVAVVMALPVAGLWAAWNDAYGRQIAIVKGVSAVVRHGPLDVSPELEAVPGGTELEVTDHKDGWLEVAGLKRGTGWIREQDVLKLPR